MALGNEAGRPGLSILRRIELETLYGVGEILSRTLDFRHTLREVLRTLDELAGMSRSLVTVVDPENGDLVVHVVSIEYESERGAVRYQPGEGLLGPSFEHVADILRWIGGDPRTGFEDVIDRTVPFAKYA